MSTECVKSNSWSLTFHYTIYFFFKLPFTSHPTLTSWPHSYCQCPSRPADQLWKEELQKGRPNWLGGEWGPGTTHRESEFPSRTSAWSEMKQRPFHPKMLTAAAWQGRNTLPQRKPSVSVGKILRTSDFEKYLGPDLYAFLEVALASEFMWLLSPVNLVCNT